MGDFVAAGDGKALAAGFSARELVVDAGDGGADGVCGGDFDVDLLDLDGIVDFFHIVGT